MKTITIEVYILDGEKFYPCRYPCQLLTYLNLN